MYGRKQIVTKIPGLPNRQVFKSINLLMRKKDSKFLKLLIKQRDNFYLIKIRYIFVGNKIC